MTSTKVYQSSIHVSSLKPDRVVFTYTNETYFRNEVRSFRTWGNESLSESPWWWSHYPSGYSWPHIIVGAVIITIIILMIVIGNFLVIWAIIHDRTLKTTQNLFIASLAFADLFLGLIVIPFSLTNELLGYWLFGIIWCELYKAVDVLLCTASIMSLCLISLDRYWSITRAVHYARQRTRKRAAVMIFTVWFISAVVSIPPLIGWKQPTRESQWPLCNLSEDIGYVLYSAFGSFFIPAFIMVFVYYKIYQAAKLRARKTVKTPNCMSDFRTEQRNSNESSVTEHGGNKDESHDVDDTTAGADNHDKRSQRVNENTSCEIIKKDGPQTSSEDDAGLQLRTVREVDIRVVKEEYSRLISTDSDSTTEANNKYVSRSAPDSSRCDPLPVCQEGLSTKQTESMSCSSSTLASCDNQNNGSIRRFQILEMRPNGSLTAAFDSGAVDSKVTVLESIRRHLLSRTRNSRKRKSPVPCSEVGRIVDLKYAERQKRKLAKARERRATVVLGLVMAAFILCWLPFFALYLASAFCAGCIPAMVFTVFFWIGYCNSALNPIIYTVFNRDFKRAFQKIIFGRRRRHR
ncbi:unnamed protein product [Candidula unifasciata]|uniref:G-protein coupled receptors family 1 profile domain-containing protein n=1 Tax=Candidula unifasciata TaxID=100452 RepID=A0A8S3YVD0_9EUPU|nr:unnamed protein product [Candidula unifasciata]